MRLYCVAEFKGTVNPDNDAQGRYRVGEVVDVADYVGEFLMRCSADAFALDEPKAPKAPKADKKAEAPAVPEIDVENASIDDLKAFAEAEKIELEAGASDDDIRAAIALAIEERAAKAKLETANGAAGGNVRPQRKSTRSR